MNYDFKTKIAKILKGALIAAGATGAVYLLEGISAIDFGEWTPAIQGVLSVLINAVRVLK